MVRINPGSNVHGDNKTGTATPGMVNVNIPAPKLLSNGKFECSMCGRIFDSRTDYDSHAMARHQPDAENISTSTEEAALPRTVSRTEFE